VEIAAVAIV